MKRETILKKTKNYPVLLYLRKHLQRLQYTDITLSLQRNERLEQIFHKTQISNPDRAK